LVEGIRAAFGESVGTWSAETVRQVIVVETAPSPDTGQ